jgi:hypothetical protein
VLPKLVIRYLQKLCLTIVLQPQTMLDLLIAILISLGFSVQSGATAEEIKAKDPVAYEQATKIMETGSYTQKEGGGGIVIIEIGGD